MQETLSAEISLNRRRKAIPNSNPQAAYARRRKEKEENGRRMAKEGLRDEGEIRGCGNYVENPT